VWKDARLPDWKVLAPGLIDTCSNYIEHPELIAQRIERFAESSARTRCGQHRLRLRHVCRLWQDRSDRDMAQARSLREGADIAAARMSRPSDGEQGARYEPR
jgi:5-methyltetrahydropteroyltriglutamate--homocysteine methyltransferase